MGNTRIAIIVSPSGVEQTMLFGESAEEQQEGLTMCGRLLPEIHKLDKAVWKHHADTTPQVRR